MPRAGVGWTGGEVLEGTAMAGPGSLIHDTIVSREPVVSDDLAADDRFEISPLFARSGAVSGATVVVGGRDELFGSLEAFSRERHAFSEHDLNFLQAVANVLATAVERTQAEGASSLAAAAMTAGDASAPAIPGPRSPSAAATPAVR